MGGKTAVNHPLGKNTIGAFKQPEYVCIELSFLKTLSSRELNAGHIELLKHGIIHDEKLFDFVQSHYLEPLDFEFFEEARTELLANIGLIVTEIEKKGFFLPVVSAKCEYKEGARFEDQIIISTRINNFSSA